MTDQRCHESRLLHHTPFPPVLDGDLGMSDVLGLAAARQHFINEIPSRLQGSPIKVVFRVRQIASRPVTGVMVEGFAIGIRVEPVGPFLLFTTTGYGAASFDRSSRHNSSDKKPNRNPVEKKATISDKKKLSECIHFYSTASIPGNWRENIPLAGIGGPLSRNSNFCIVSSICNQELLDRSISLVVLDVTAFSDLIVSIVPIVPIVSIVLHQKLSDNVF